MKMQNLIIEELSFTHVGAVADYHRVFVDGIQTVYEENPEITEKVLRMILGDDSAGDICMHDNSRVKAIMTTEGDSCIITYTSCAGQLCRSGRRTEDLLKYKQKILRPGEEREILCFSGARLYPTRLQQYWEDPESLRGLCDTKTFRHYLRRYISTFCPERLLPNKNLWLRLQNNGRFSVHLGRKGEEVLCLSETDYRVFLYLCFLHLRRFWDTIRRRSRFPAPSLPLVIRDFSSCLDAHVDYKELLLRGKDISSQIILIKDRETY